MRSPRAALPLRSAPASAHVGGWLLAAAAFTALWLAFAEWLLPALVTSAYRGGGPALLRAAMDGRDQIPLAGYLADCHVLSTRVLAWTAGITCFGALWLARRCTLERHWFAPASLRELALVRCVAVASQLFVWFTPSHMSLDFQLSLAAADDALFRPLYALQALLLPLTGGARPGPELLRAVWYLGALSGSCALLGLLTRPALLAFAASSTLFITHAYGYGEFHHTETLEVVALWTLAFAPCGAALSADAALLRAWRRARGRPAARRETSEFARWPLRLLQSMFALTYFAAGVAKLMNGGLGWFSGTTLAYYFAYDGLRDELPLGIWLSGHAAWLPPLALTAVLFELTFWIAVLVPSAAIFYVAAGLGIHLGIYVIHGPPFFQHMALFVVFIEPIRASLRHAFARATAASPALTILYDGQCGVCIRTRALLESLDRSARLHFVDLESEWSTVAPRLLGVTQDQARHSMHVFDAAGTIHRGFFAFRRVAASLPRLWPLLPLLWLPPAGWLGPHIYTAIAQRRRRLACRSGSCALPTRHAS